MLRSIHRNAHIAVIGAGAAGLMAAIAAGRAARERGVASRIVALDGARSLGAKILVAGGGRCNVTHEHVDEKAFAGSTRPAIRNVLARFDVTQTIAFFAELGVTLKREETGKLFPTTDRARTVLDALLRAAGDVDVEIVNPWRVEALSRPASPDEAFLLTSASGESLLADRVILATGGLSLPKSGSDGHGHALARALGHTITPRVFPALVPLLLPDGHPLRGVSGVAAQATVAVRGGNGKRVASFTDSVLCTHFGLSGPAFLDVSRWLTAARDEDPRTALIVNWIPSTTAEQFDEQVRNPSARGAGDGSSPRTPRQLLRSTLAERLVDALCAIAAIDPGASLRQLTREERRAFVDAVTQCELPITGDRGYGHAEVTAGGVPLGEVHLSTLESRRCPGLHLCGEILDVDGRIGGFNFQWAWASGWVAGRAAAG